MLCRRCEEDKPSERFPWGRSGKRHSDVCWACTEDAAQALSVVKMGWRKTWLDPKTGRMTRRCPRCRIVKDLEKGYRKHGKKKGTRQYYPICKQCTKDEWKKYPRKRNPEKDKANQKRYRDKVMADPEKHAKLSEARRMGHRLRRERLGLPVRPETWKRPKAMKAPEKKYKHRLPSKPLAAFVEDLAIKRGESFTELCKWLEVSPRTVFAWRHDQRDANFDVAERIMVRTDTIWEQVWPRVEYPDVYVGLLAD